PSRSQGKGSAMRGRMTRWLSSVTVLLLAGLVPAAPPDPKGTAFFEQNVRPLLTEHCYKCHAKDAKSVRGGLLLDSKAGWMKGGDSGPVIVPGAPDKSLLIKALRYDDEPKMPPKGKLADKDIALLTQWVKLGAPDPRDGAVAAATKKTIDLEQGRRYWAFQPLARPAVPVVKDPAWCRTDVDRFILARLEEKGLSPNPVADRRRLIRRAAFDLTGLPPTPEEVERFVHDPAPDAYARLIDRLLDSPHFGERWARH